MSDQICRVCQRYVKLTYYCDDCGANCCSDCLHEKKVEFYSCQDCNSKNLEISGSEKKKTCKECGNENIVKVKQLIKSCPKCGSHKIINVYEKKEELEKNFLELIKNSRFFINPLRAVLENLFSLQQEIKSARSPPVRCYHFPKMESDLLGLFKLFIYVQSTLHDKITGHFQQLVLYKEYFFDIYTQPNTSITVIEGIFEGLIRSYNAINDFVLNNVKTFNESIESYGQNLRFIRKISEYFSTYRKFLKLAEKEKPVYAIHAKLSNGLDTEQKYKKDSGILFITNLDLSFVHKYGLRKKKLITTFKAPVRDLIKIRERGKVFKKLYLEFEYGKYEFTLPPKAIPRVVEYILLARTFDESTIYDEKSAKKLQNIDIEVNSLEKFIEESINSFFSLKCQYNKGYESASEYIQGISQTRNFNPHQNQNLEYQNRNQGIAHPNPNTGQYWSNKPPTQNINPYPEPRYYSYIPPNQTQQLGFVNNYRELNNQYQGPLLDESKFFIQNLYNPNRYQNYNPRNVNQNDTFLHQNDDSILSRIMGNNPNSYQSYPNSVNSHILSEGNNSMFQEYTKNHLTELFNRNQPIEQQSYRQKRELFKLDREKNEKLLELEKERYSLKATLKKLETKFDQGSISESDYFRTFRNLNKEIYLIDNKIQDLQQKLEELKSLKQSSRSFDNKGFYS